MQRSDVLIHGVGALRDLGADTQKQEVIKLKTYNICTYFVLLQTPRADSYFTSSPSWDSLICFRDSSAVCVAFAT